MIRKIKQWLRSRKTQTPEFEAEHLFTREEVIEIVAEVKRVAYNDGKRDGLNIARAQATQSLKEILWLQNNQNKTK